MSSNRRNIPDMATNFSFLPQVTDRTPEEFVVDILKIHENQYTPINHIPTIFGRKINLLALYNAVAKRGGFKRMNTEISWEGVLLDLKMPIKCANASVALRSIFQRHLEPFERLQRNKATISDIEEELQMESDNRYKNPTQRTTLSHCNFNPISMVYRTDIHQINSHKRQEYGLSCDLTDVVEFQKLELSLKSGLVNEIEFSLNTILLLSFQNHGIQLCRNYRLLDRILNTVGIGDLVLLKELSEQDQSTRRFLQFWNETVIFEKGRKFLLPDIFIIDQNFIPQKERLNKIFPVYDELTVYDKEGQRIQLVATVIRNLALDSSNSRFLTQNPQCMRFIMLSCYTSHFSLRQLGLEILSLISFPVVGILRVTLRHLLADLINSENRVERLRGLELLANLSDPKVSLDNIEFFNGLPKSLFASLISMLIIHDLHIVVLALEAVYSLSEVNPQICTKLVECSTETLVSLYVLLNLEAQVMGTQSLIRIRVMQGPGVISSTQSHSTINNVKVVQPQSNHKQLATSLMPPPPVPIHKVPTTTVTIPHGNHYKSQIYPTIEAHAVPSKQHTIQKITKNNTELPIVSTEIKTTSSTVLSTTDVALQNNISKESIMNSKTISTTDQANITNGQTLPSNTIINYSVANISPMPLPTFKNHNSPPKSICISTIQNTQGSQQSFLTINKPAISLPSEPNVHTKCLAPPIANIVIDNSNTLSVNETSTIQVFTNKQDFVKTWLLSNYIESAQCTVPLFVMYKQLQVAVQNYFKDSEMVTAEEFHRLVRMLFPQVQLVQLHIDTGVEIHYYNLKVFQKSSKFDTLLESNTCKFKQITHSIENDNSKISAPQICTAQINSVSNPQISNDTTVEQKLQKRHIADIINGHSTENDHFQTKKPRIDNQHDEAGHNNTIHEIHYIKDAHVDKVPTNGITAQKQANERNMQAYTNVVSNKLVNGLLLEEIKPDSETKIFLTSTISPMHCDSLVNGTNGRGEDTMDSELGRIIFNIKTTKSQTTIHTPSTIHQSPSTNVSNPFETTIPSLLEDTPEQNSNKRGVKKNTFNQLGRTRSRFRNNSSSSKGKQRGSSSQRPHNLSYLYICEWDNCLQSFDKPQKVYGHVYTNHFMTLRTEVESMCFWACCQDTIQRTPLPLLNHVNEQHCNNVALESARQIRLAKEKEKSTYSLPNIVIKTEAEGTTKLLNICSFQTNTQSETSIDPSASDQSINLSSLSQSSDIPITLLSKCSIFQPPVFTQASITTSSQSLSTVEQMIVCSNALPQPFSNFPKTTTSTPNKELDLKLLSCQSQTTETSIPESSISRSSQQDSPHINTTTNTVTTTTPLNTSHRDSIITSTLPSVKHPLKEGPVTKHIRFLSALILRNLCQCSPEAQRFVAVRHQEIFEISISGCESSRALSECLFYSNIDMTGFTLKRKSPL